jgi:hypothetical protein
MIAGMSHTFLVIKYYSDDHGGSLIKDKEEMELPKLNGSESYSIGLFMTKKEITH